MSHWGRWTGSSSCGTGAGVHTLEDLSCPLLSVSDSPSPVVDISQVPVNEVTPMEGCSSCQSPPATGPAPQELSFGMAGGHSPDMAEPLKAYLPNLFLQWHHPCSLQDVSVPNSVPQGDPQDDTKERI